MIGPSHADAAQLAVAHEIFAFWKGKVVGKETLQARHAAGFVANADAEAGLNPNAIGDHGHAFYLPQIHADRAQIIKAGCGIDMTRRPAPRVEEQLAAMLWELTHIPAVGLAHILAAKTAHEAGAAIARYYERPADKAQWDARGRLAEAWLRYLV